MTLIELLLALAITAMVGAAIAAMLHAATLGATEGADRRRLVVQFKRLDARLGAALRGSRLVLGRGNNYLVLWTSDTDLNAGPNLSELRLIEWSADGTVSSWTPDVTPGSAADILYDLDDFDGNPRQMLLDTDAFVEEIWETGVRSVEVGFDDQSPTVQSARLVTYRIGIGNGAATATVIGAAAMRNF